MDDAIHDAAEHGEAYDGLQDRTVGRSERTTGQGSGQGTRKTRHSVGQCKCNSAGRNAVQGGIKWGGGQGSLFDTVVGSARGIAEPPTMHDKLFIFASFHLLFTFFRKMARFSFGTQ